MQIALDFPLFVKEPNHAEVRIDSCSSRHCRRGKDPQGCYAPVCLVNKIFLLLESNFTKVFNVSGRSSGTFQKSTRKLSVAKKSNRTPFLTKSPTNTLMASTLAADLFTMRQVLVGLYVITIV